MDLGLRSNQRVEAMSHNQSFQQKVGLENTRRRLQLYDDIDLIASKVEYLDNRVYDALQSLSAARPSTTIEKLSASCEPSGSMLKEILGNQLTSLDTLVSQSEELEDLQRRALENLPA